MSDSSAALRFIFSKSTEEWNVFMAERNPKEEWLKFEPFQQAQGRFLVQIDSRTFYSDEMCGWRNLCGSSIDALDFSGRDLSGVDFSGSSFGVVSFRRCGLRAADFSGCTFEQVDFSGALLYGTRFVGTTFKQANFTEAWIYCSNFGGKPLPGSDFTSTKICAASRNSMRAPFKAQR